MNEAHKFAKNYVFLFISRAIMLVGNAIVLLMIGWWLPVADFGRFTFALALAGLLSIIVSMGMDQWSVAYLPRQRKSASSFAGGAFSLGAALIIPFMAVLTGICLFSGFDPEQSALVILLGLAMGFQTNTKLGAALCQALERNELGVPINFARNASMVLAVVVWALFLKGSVFWLAVLWAGAQIPAWLVGIRVIGRKACGIQWEVGPKPWWWIIKNAYVFALISLVMTSGGRFETILLKYLKADIMQVGYFQMAIRLALMGAIPAATLCQVFRPIISRKFGESPEAFKRAVCLFHKFQFIAAIATLGFVAVFSKDILFLLFRERYLPAASILSVLALAQMILYAPPAWDVFHVTGLQKYAFYIMLVQIILTICVNLIVIPFYGMFGAACVMVGTACVTRLVTLGLFRHRQYPLMDSWKPYGTSTICMLVALFGAFVAHSLAGILLATPTFVLIFTLMGYMIVLSGSEKVMAKNLWRKVSNKLCGS